MIGVLISCFIIGYILIVFEHPLKLDKTVPALFAGVMCWTIVSVGKIPIIGDGSLDNTISNAVLHHLGKITEILIFLIGAMTIVEVVDAHKGFTLITNRITTQNKIKLLWLISWLAFFLSSVLDNLTTTIIFISLLHKLISDKNQRIWYVCFVVIAANAGGAWSPIGDVTTTMLWIEDKVSTVQLITKLILPSILCLLVPLSLASLMPAFKGNLSQSSDPNVNAFKDVPILSSKVILITGVLGLLFVPVFKTITHLPPWMGMMISLAMIWLISDMIKPVSDFDESKRYPYTVKNALTRIEMPSVLFFLGILLGITSLESTGILRQLANSLDAAIPNRDLVATVIGILSAIVDNVPLVAASIGMYIEPMDSKIWHFIAYSAGTGGSMLIIGSAAGVAAMGIEKINFIWYMKNITWLAAVGFFAGCIAVSFLA